MEESSDIPEAPPGDSLPVTSIRELLSLAAIVALADLAIYRGGGYSGIAAVCAGTPLLLRCGSQHSRPTRDLIVLALLITAIAIRLVWCGSPMATVIAIALVFMFAMAIAGRRPFLIELLAFAGEVQANAYNGLARYRRSAVQRLSGSAVSPKAATLLGVILPAAAVSVFGLLFLFANPDLATKFGEQIARLMSRARDWVMQLSFGELLFCLAMAWLGIGLLRARPAAALEVEEEAIDRDAVPVSEALYHGFRNTLIAVTALFAAYLVFEFQTLWFRKFPKGFYYAGYAHQGALYLTVALGLATVILSAIFRGRMLFDARLPALRRWGILWAIENLLLATAVYNRLFIYIDFNGMTRMRTVGLLGVSAVVAGCLLVMVKIVRNRNSTWLLRRQLWGLAFAFYLYATLPIDSWVIRYNVRKVLAGDLAPSVQITEHPTSTEGLLELSPLLSASDATIQNGVRAYLALEWEHRKGRQPADWSHFQLADERFRAQLESLAGSLEAYTAPEQRRLDWEKFKTYAYQWY